MSILAWSAAGNPRGATAAPAVVEEVLRRARMAGYDVSRLTAIYVYGCGEAAGTERTGAMRRSAHAHVGATDSHRGIICIKGGPARMTRRLVAHEIAHVLTYAGHTAAWRECVTRLGHPSEAKRYQR